jgi:enamine deaminase RidA (YjgF/YER057c/UK114 family)
MRTVSWPAPAGSTPGSGFAAKELVPQFEQALKNVLAVLAEALGLPHHICRMTA